jgi:hypothetical protein
VLVRFYGVLVATVIVPTLGTSVVRLFPHFPRLLDSTLPMHNIS